MRPKHAEPKRQLIVNVEMISDTYGAVACATLLGDSSCGHLVHGTGLAKKEPGDPYDEVIAMNLAVGRALADLSRQMQQHGRELVEDAMDTQRMEQVDSLLRGFQRDRRGVGPRTLMPLKQIQKQWGKKAAQVAAARRGVQWPPVKKNATKKSDS